MLIFFCVALSMLACVISFEESYNKDFREILEEKERLMEIKNKIYNFCIHPQALCSCTVNTEDSFTFSCYNDDSENDVVIKISDFINDTVVFTCVNVKSFTQVPDFKHYIASLKVYLKNCTVPDNEIIEQLSTKISKGNFYQFFQFRKDQNNLTEVTNEIFDKTVNNFKDSETHLDKADQKMSTKIQGDVTTIEINCNGMCPLDPSILASLINLEELTIKGDIVFTSTENVFKYNQRLTRIELKDMEFFQIPSKLFAEMIYIRKISISNVHLRRLPEDLFYSSKYIEEIELTENKIKSLPKNIFVDQINLIILDLKHNNLEKLVDGLFNATINLKTLILSHNKLRRVSRSLFANLGKLEILLLNNNALKTIDDSFKNLINLQLIDLGHNQLLYSEIINSFDLLEKLKKINLSHSNLSQFTVSNLTNFYNLQVLDLSHNNISKINFDAWRIFALKESCFIDLSFNNITEFKAQEFPKFLTRIKLIRNVPLFNIDLDNNPIACDCNALELIQFINKKTIPYDTHNIFEIDAKNIRCIKPNHLYDRLLRNLSSVELICNIDKDCPEGCECKQRPVDETLIFECLSTNQKLPMLPKFHDLNLTNVELHAANNQIESIQLINIPDDLKLLDLRNNSLKTLSNTVLKRFQSIDKLHLSGNLWDCGCSAVDFVHFFHQFRSKIIDADHMFCADGTSFKSLEPKDLCIQLIEVFVLILMGTSIIGLLSLICVIFKKKIKIWLYAHNCCLWWVTEEEADKDMIYDAFFVFSHFDDSFVTDTIINLEEKGFKCCVHHRDWKAGEMIVTQALKSIKSSRRIIVVLSPTFVESTWATWEFRVALKHAFNERRSRVLVIIHGDVSLIDDLDDDLKRYIAYNTYLKSGDEWFDSKLLYAMPHKTVPEIYDDSSLTSTISA